MMASKLCLCLFIYLILHAEMSFRDLNTRFSGINHAFLSQAVLKLDSVRHSLDAFINSETIIIGHTLENDLKALRMVHCRCIDTSILFPHCKGHPFRRALRDL